MEPGPEVAILLSGTLRLSAGPPSSSAPTSSCPFAVLAVTPAVLSPSTSLNEKFTETQGLRILQGSASHRGTRARHLGAQPAEQKGYWPRHPFQWNDGLYLPLNAFL